MNILSFASLLIYRIHWELINHLPQFRDHNLVEQLFFVDKIALTSPEVLLKHTHIPSCLEKTLTSLNYFVIEALFPLDSNRCYF